MTPSRGKDECEREFEKVLIFHPTPSFHYTYCRTKLGLAAVPGPLRGDHNKTRRVDSSWKAGKALSQKG